MTNIDRPAPRRWLAVAGLFFKLGAISFGGPAVHIAHMEQEAVRKRSWLSREHFLDLLAATNLVPGDVILFYTDGVIETLNLAGEEFGEERLASVLCAHRDEPAEAIADAIDVAVRGFAGDAAQYDDLTLIVVKRE
jgi:hypothetical protein